MLVAAWPQRPAGGPWRRLIRISAAAYVSIGDIEHLARALPGSLAAVAD